MTFGQWVGLNIKSSAESLDQTVFMAQLEGRKLNPLESFAIEVLIAVCGWKDLKEARGAFQQHLKRETDK